MYSFPRLHLPPKAHAAAKAAGKPVDTFYCLQVPSWSPTARAQGRGCMRGTAWVGQARGRRSGQVAALQRRCCYCCSCWSQFFVDVWSLGHGAFWDASHNALPPCPPAFALVACLHLTHPHLLPTRSNRSCSRRPAS